jgi:hypothetical protein
MKISPANYNNWDDFLEDYTYELDRIHEENKEKEMNLTE